MSRISRLLVFLALAAVVALPLAAADDVTKTGTFVWERDDKDISGDLKAVFTPVAEGEWKVAFHFDWDDGPHVYAGTAKGNLKNGELSGEVESDNDERKSTFTFSGSFDKGTFNGTHGSMRDGKLNNLGNLTLK